MKTYTKNNKVYNEKNEVAVLISPGYGAGWSTWNNENYRDTLLMHPNLVMRVLEDKRHEIAEELLKDLFGFEDVYIGSNVEQLEVEWVPEGERIQIYEYDGSESIQYLGNAGFTV